MKYGLIGRKLTHSFSPDIHRMLGKEDDYKLMELEPEELDEFFAKRQFKGINVTIPYKETVLKYLDEISDEAKEIGAVNTIVNNHGKLYGYNTDVKGLYVMFRHPGIYDFRDKYVYVLGTGGAAKAAGYAAKMYGAMRVLYVSRTQKPGAITYKEFYKDKEYVNIIINATPVGMYPNIDDSPILLSGFKELSAVYAIWFKLKKNTHFIVPN